MASLVSVLASGIVNAPAGSAEFFTLGTSDLSTLVYSDSDGLTAVTSTDLDANGSAIRYVGEPVTVRVYDSTGALVRGPFDHIEDAKVVRLESPAFTGPDESGQIVAGGATTEQAAWSLFFQSFGATDAFVAVSGSAALLKTLLAATNNSVFVNVVSYGADPNGIQDSTAYIQSAVNFASSAGGGIVYFPPGTYKITAAISINFGTYMLGIPGNSIIRMYTTGVNGWLSAGSGDFVFFGLNFESFPVTNTGRCIAGAGSGRLHVQACNFAAFAGTHLYANTVQSDMRVVSCHFSSSVAAGATVPFLGSGGLAKVTFTDTVFDFSGPATGYIMFGNNTVLELDSCQINHSATAGGYVFQGGEVTMTGGSIRCTALAGSTILQVVKTGTAAAPAKFTGVSFFCNATGFIHLQETGSSLVITDAGCYADATNDNIFLGTAGAAAGAAPSALRDSLKKVTSAATASYTPDAAKYGIHIYTQTAGAAFVLNNPTANCGPFGRLVVIWVNSSGSNITLTFGTAYAAPAAIVVNTGQAAMWEFIKGDGTITTKYVAIGPQTVFTP